MADEEKALTNLLRRHIRAWEPIFIDALSRVANPREPINMKRGRARCLRGLEIGGLPT
jgi:hypothetical protein